MNNCISRFASAAEKQFMDGWCSMLYYVAYIYPNIKRRELMSTIASNQLDTTELELIKYISHILNLTSIIISNNLLNSLSGKGSEKLGGSIDWWVDLCDCRDAFVSENELSNDTSIGGADDSDLMAPGKYCLLETF